MPRFKESITVGGHVAAPATEQPAPVADTEAAPRRRAVHATDKLVTVEDVSAAVKAAKGERV